MKVQHVHDSPGTLKCGSELGQELALLSVLHAGDGPTVAGLALQGTPVAIEVPIDKADTGAKGREIPRKGYEFAASDRGLLQGRRHPVKGGEARGFVPVDAPETYERRPGPIPD